LITGVILSKPTGGKSVSLNVQFTNTFRTDVGAEEAAKDGTTGFE
jgi:hypothetical protein